tara:strand:- start:784 stop:1506 length:723 start_codon:yes stop_codon:yes gene_type:complete
MVDKNVLTLQMNLSRLGYQPGRLDGLWGKRTAAALRVAARDHNLQIGSGGGVSFRVCNDVASVVDQARIAVAPVSDRVWALFHYGTSELRAAIDLAMVEAVMFGERAQFFLAQVAHESGGFRYMEEIADGSDYNGRRDLGNHHGENFGVRYKGRGMLQLTGFYNYERFGDLLQLDLSGNPETAADPIVSARIAVTYWTDRGLNSLSDQSDFRGVTKAINGGYNGYEDRLNWLNRIKSARG